MDNKATLNIPIYKDLSSILQSSEALILDVWGVLWDGIKVYPEAVTTLKEVKKLNTGYNKRKRNISQLFFLLIV